MNSIGIGYAAIMLLLCSAGQAREAEDYPRAMPIEGCVNVFAANATLLSGGQPEGTAAFKALAAAGVKTIISVDGAKPDVEAAAQFGMRYVHLPIGYDGVGRSRTIELSRAVRDLPGKTYIHCHHGKHRSPAATASVMVCSHGWSGEEGIEFLERAGTAESYSGLYSDVRRMIAASKAELDAADNKFPAVAIVPGGVELMVQIEHRFDALENAKAAGWKVSPAHPDIVPAHEALQLMELFRESVRIDSTGRKPGYHKFMKQSETAAENLEKAIRSGDMLASDKAFGLIKNTCTACHTQYRNKFGRR
ncbi:MAG: cytochrome c [Candidatus Hydrogenedentes bacterium]|nr:cytochrome c [Candidatus Hydrogenedentota bacterium]